MLITNIGSNRLNNGQNLIKGFFQRGSFTQIER